jgi:hypothetical protein
MHSGATTAAAAAAAAPPPQHPRPVAVAAPPHPSSRNSSSALAQAPTGAHAAAGSSLWAGSSSNGPQQQQPPQQQQQQGGRVFVGGKVVQLEELLDAEDELRRTRLIDLLMNDARAEFNVYATQVMQDLGGSGTQEQTWHAVCGVALCGGDVSVIASVACRQHQGHSEVDDSVELSCGGLFFLMFLIALDTSGTCADCLPCVTVLLTNWFPSVTGCPREAGCAHPAAQGSAQQADSTQPGRSAPNGGCVCPVPHRCTK